MKHLPLNLSYDGKDFPVDAEGGPSINLFALNVSKVVLRTLKVMIGRTGHNTAVKVKVTLALFKSDCRRDPRGTVGSPSPILMKLAPVVHLGLK